MSRPVGPSRGGAAPAPAAHAPDHCPLRPWAETVVSGVRTAYRWDTPYLRRMRAHYTIVYWNPGPGAAVTAAGERCVLDAGTVLVIPAGTWFQRENLAPFDHWWSHLRCAATPAAPGAQRVAATGELRRLLQRLWRRALDQGMAAPATQADVHAALALTLARIAWGGAGRSIADPRLDALVRALEAQHYPHRTNGELAARLDMHPKAFCRLFHQVLGAAPQDWLRCGRLELAAERLGEGMSVDEAAAAGGFADRFHFGRLFRRHHGVGPGHYRRFLAGGGGDPWRGEPTGTRR